MFSVLLARSPPLSVSVAVYVDKVVYSAAFNMALPASVWYIIIPTYINHQSRHLPVSIYAIKQFIVVDLFVLMRQCVGWRRLGGK